MDREIIIVKSKLLGDIRMLIIDDRKYFVAKDVAKALRYKNTRDAIKHHIKDKDKRMFPLSTTQGVLDTVITNINGVCSLIYLAKLLNTKQKNDVANELIELGVMGEEKRVLICINENKSLDTIERQLNVIFEDVVMKRNQKLANYNVDIYLENFNIGIFYDNRNEEGFDEEARILERLIIREQTDCEFVVVGQGEHYLVNSAIAIRELFKIISK